MWKFHVKNKVRKRCNRAPYTSTTFLKNEKKNGAPSSSHCVCLPGCLPTALAAKSLAVGCLPGRSVDFHHSLVDMVLFSPFRQTSHFVSQRV